MSQLKEGKEERESSNCLLKGEGERSLEKGAGGDTRKKGEGRRRKEGRREGRKARPLASFRRRKLLSKSDPTSRALSYLPTSLPLCHCPLRLSNLIPTCSWGFGICVSHRGRSASRAPLSVQISRFRVGLSFFCVDFGCPTFSCFWVVGFVCFFRGGKLG